MAETKRPLDERKISVVDELLKEGCPGDQVMNDYDFSRSAQFYRVGPPGAVRHRVFVSKEFFDDHATDEIQGLLRGWRLLEHIKQAGAKTVIVTNGGITTVGT